MSVFDELDGKLGAQLNLWREIQFKDLSTLNAQIQKSNIPGLVPAEEKSEGESK